MRKFLLVNFNIFVIIHLFSVLRTTNADLWGALTSDGVDPSLNKEEYEKVLCANDKIDCYKFGSCHDYDGNEEDCTDWSERCTYQCEKCYANSEIANPDDGIPQCLDHPRDQYTKCKFASDKYIHKNGAVCFQKERTDWKNDCAAPTIFLALNLNGEDVEASSGILYESEVLHSGKENRLSGKSDETIYKVVSDEEVEISENDRALYETWVSPVPTGEDGQRKCLVYEVLDIGRDKEYFGLVLTFLEENWQPDFVDVLFQHVTIEFAGVPYSFKMENIPFRTEGRTYIYDVETAFEVIKWTGSKINLIVSNLDNWVTLQNTVGPMMISICSGDCSQTGNDPPFRLAALLVKRYAKQGTCFRTDDPVECVLGEYCVYNTYYKTCSFDEGVYRIFGAFPKLRKQTKYRCLKFYRYYLFSYGRPWKSTVANADSSCEGVVEILARNFNGGTVTHPDENVVYKSTTFETLKEEAEVTTLIKGIDKAEMEKSCKWSALSFLLPWDFEMSFHDRHVYVTAFELVRILSPRDSQCITYKVSIKETGYYQLKTKLMVPYEEEYNERMFDIELNGILAAPTIDASKMNSKHSCRPLEVVVFFEVIDSVNEGIRILEIDENPHSEIKDETMPLSFCNSPSDKLTKGAVINGFSLFKYIV